MMMMMMVDDDNCDAEQSVLAWLVVLS